MIRKATIDDVQSKLEMVARDLVAQAVQKKLKLQSDFARRGTLNSSMFGGALQRACDEGMEQATSTILGELRQAINLTELDPLALRNAAEDIMQNLIPQFQKVFTPSGSRGMHPALEMPDRTANMRERLELHFRHFDSGIFEPADPEPLSVTNYNTTNSLQAQNAYGVQQGTHHSTMNVSISIDQRAAMQAILDLQTEMESITAPSHQLSEMQADLETIKAQIGKSEPNRTILGEALQSIRSIAEGVAVELLSPKAAIAIAALSSAVGLG